MLDQVGIKVKLHDYRGNIGQLLKVRNTGKITGIGNFGWGTSFRLRRRRHPAAVVL